MSHVASRAALAAALLVAVLVSDGPRAAVAAPASALDRADLAFVVHEGGAAWVVLRRGILQSERDVTASEGPLTLLDRGVTALRPAVPARLPNALARWQGRPLALSGLDGAPACTASVGDLHEMVRYQPHFGQVQAWDGEDGEGRWDDGRVAETAWQSANEGDHFLVGRLVPAKGEDCKGAVVARAADAPALRVIGARAAADSRLRAAALKRLRALSAWKAIQKGYEQPEGARGRRRPWDEHDGAKPSVTVFHDAAAKKRYVWVGAQAGEGCGAFSGQLWALWSVSGRGKGTWALLTPEADGPEDTREWFVPALAIDADGDGAPELLDRVRIYAPAAGSDGAPWTESVEPNSYDCPC